MYHVHVADSSAETSFIDAQIEIESELAASHNRIPGVASPGFHRLLMLGAYLGRINGILLAVYILAWTLLALFIWAAHMDSLEIGFVVGIGFLTFAIVDWLVLAALPRRRRSFGPVAPPLMALELIRAMVTIVPALLPLGPLWIATLVEISNFALTGYILYSMWSEPLRLTLTRLTLKSRRLRGAPPLRVLHVTDLHIERLTRREAKLVKWIGDLRPDLIVYTGDLLNFSYLGDEDARADCIQLLSQLRAPLGVYAVAGTPLVDTPEVQAAIYPQAPHIRLLKNERVEIEGYPQLQIIGLTCTHDPVLDRPKLDRLLAALPPDKFTLLLYHSPDLMPEASLAGIDLYLCGHTHGGQVRAPLYGALVTGSFYRKRYEMGPYRERNTMLYVSRGVGMEGMGAPRMRFLCPPEVELIELRSDET